MATKKFTKRECENIENIVRNKLTWNDDVHVDAHLMCPDWFIIEIDEKQGSTIPQLIKQFSRFSMRWK